MKVVINGGFGGFNLSDEAFEKFLDRKHIAWEKRTGEYGNTEYFHARHMDSEDHYLSGRELTKDRADLDLVGVVEEMGVKANGFCAELVIVEVPDDAKWHICEYDGMEHVAENHRTWGNQL